MTEKVNNESKFAKYYWLCVPDDWSMCMRLTITIVANYISMNGSCDVPLHIICKYVGAKPTAVREALNTLVSSGLLVAEPVQYKPTVYRFGKQWEIFITPPPNEGVKTPPPNGVPRQTEGTPPPNGGDSSAKRCVLKNNKEIPKRIIPKKVWSDKSDPHTQDALLYSEDNEEVKNKPKIYLYVAATALADVIGVSFNSLAKGRQGGLCNAVKRHSKIYDLDISDYHTMEVLASFYQQIFGKDGIWYDEYKCKKIGWPFHGKEGDMSPPTEKQISDVWGTSFVKQQFDTTAYN